METALIQMFAVIGGLGIAGFAIFTELMASAERRYSDAFHRLAKEINAPEIHHMTIKLSSVEFGSRGQIPWIAIRPNTGKQITSQDDKSDFRTLVSEEFFAVSAEGFALPTRPPDPKGVSFEGWPSSLGVAGRLPKAERQRIFPAIKKTIELAESPETRTFWVGVTYRKAKIIFSAWLAYRRLHGWRIAFILLTAAGWIGAMIVASLPVIGFLF